MDENTPAEQLAIAEEHARACFNALHRHAADTSSRCGCHLKTGDFPVVGLGCDVGAMCLDEYRIATARVRDLRPQTCQPQPEGEHPDVP